LRRNAERSMPTNSSNGYRSYAVRTLDEQKRIVEEFGLKLE
jgi:hypothetical protein